MNPPASHSANRSPSMLRFFASRGIPPPPPMTDAEAAEWDRKQADADAEIDRIHGNDPADIQRAAAYLAAIRARRELGGPPHRWVDAGLMQPDFLTEEFPGVTAWVTAGEGRWTGYDDSAGGRRLVLARGARYATAVIDERWADRGLADAKFAWLEDRFDDIVG